jgi:phage terminase large subunit GpA-like protein
MSAGFTVVPGIGPEVLAAFQKSAEVLMPPPKLTLTEWAERNIVLSSEDSAYGGQPYRARIAPYQRGMQDALLEPGVRKVVFWTSSQIGKTQVMKNGMAYFMKEDPSPMLFMLPTLDLAAKVSEQRIAPMLRDCPALRGLVAEGGRRRGNSTLVKLFTGGALFMIGSNAPASVSSMPIRIFFSDEIDRNARSAGEEGSPLKLGEKRQTTFWNALGVYASTCTIEGDSPIIDEYEESDRRKYHVPCLRCGELQVLKWKSATKKRLIFPQDEEPTIDNTYYVCEYCEGRLYEFDKPEMLSLGEWRAERPEIHDVRGFWINELYSPFSKWCDMARTFKEAMRRRENPELLKTFVNTALAEPWEDEAESLDGNELMLRREEYPPPSLPKGVTVLTCGVDVQEDRIELEVVGHGLGEETWSVDYRRFDGDTSRTEAPKREDGTVDPLKLSPWQRLDKFLEDTQYMHALGVRLPIAATLVDSGDQTQVVYSFTQKMQEKGIRCYASKGVPGWGKAPVAKWNRNNRPRVKMYPIAVNVLKKLVYDRLKITEHGAGYMHFSKRKNDAEYFAQLTAEKITKGRDKQGYAVKKWELKKAGSRNEALDCRVYATAAFYTLSLNPARLLEDLRKDLLDRAKLAQRDRRAHVPAGQMPLIELADQVPEDTEPQTPAEVESTAVEPVPESPREFAERIVNAVESNIAETAVALEAELEQAKKAEAEQPQTASRPAIRVGRGGWV